MSDSYYIGANIFIAALPILYLFGLFQTPVFKYIPRLTIISTIVLFFISVIIVIFHNEEHLDVSKIPFKKMIGTIWFFVSIFFILNVIFFFSKYLLFYSTFTSVLFSIIFIILILATLVSSQSFLITFHHNDLDQDLISELFEDIIFTIPCLVSDFFTWLQGEITGLPSPTIMLSMLIVLFTIVFYLFPFILGKMKYVKGVPLITSPKSLDNVVLRLSQDQLKDKIISFKPVATRKLLEKNNEFKNYLDDNKIEGFDENIHLLDKKLMFSNSDFKSLDEKEKIMVKNATTLDDFNTPSEFNQYIKSILKSGQDSRFPYLSNMIKEYTDNNNKYIHDKSTSFVDWINRSNNVNDLTYHCAITFWVYFDSSIQNSQHSGDDGLIFTYSDNPKIVYDYNEKAIISTITKCNYKTVSSEKRQMECEDNVIYKSDNILFQRWNLFVVNFNYGTLDIFINNNLVSSTQNVSPYIERPFLQFGSSSHKLYNCGICSASYHDKPLTLSNISEMYRNSESPCFDGKL